MSKDATVITGKSTGLTKEAFVIKAITVLPRKLKGKEELEKGIHVVFSKFNVLYQAEFGCNLDETKADLAKMEKDGLIQIRPVKKGVKLYHGNEEFEPSAEEIASDKMGITLD